MKKKKTYKVVCKCKVCGQIFFNEENNRVKVYCSEECRKKARQDYNTDYIKRRRAEDPVFQKKRNELVCRTNQQRLTKQRWEKRKKEAKAILDLIKQDNSVEVLAKYIDQNYTVKRRPIPQKHFCEEEESAIERLKDLKIKSVLSLYD